MLCDLDGITYEYFEFEEEICLKRYCPEFKTNVEIYMPKHPGEGTVEAETMKLLSSMYIASVINHDERGIQEDIDGRDTRDG